MGVNPDRESLESNEPFNQDKVTTQRGRRIEAIEYMEDEGVDVIETQRFYFDLFRSFNIFLHSQISLLFVCVLTID